MGMPNHNNLRMFSKRQPPFQISNKTDHQAVFAVTSSQGDFCNRWWDVVEEYSSLNLTYKTDIFPALGGIVKQIQEYRHSRYLAGLWEDSLIGDLLWKAWYGSEQPPGRPLDPRAPTWSWGSVDAEKIDYSMFGVEQVRLIERHVKILSVLPTQGC